MTDDPKVEKRMDVSSFTEIRSEPISVASFSTKDVEKVLGGQHAYVEVRPQVEYPLAACLDLPKTA